MSNKENQENAENKEARKPRPNTLAITRDIDTFDEKTGNIYETVVVLSKRANQIASDVKEELHEKMQEFTSTRDTMEEILENREQIDLARHYEQMPKSSLLAIEEYLEDKIYFRKPEE
ncbi:MAG: DNA-directed RNA polymerase subunit omega [Bacteroidales bacterium]|nr:DNA-directed RNA polymerase subunit omega [Bacteroidales bacterium]